MKLRISLNVIKFACLLIATYVVYYLLLQDNQFHLSIASIVKLDKHRNHFLIVGMLPIYIAFMIFGAASVALYISSKLQSWIIRYKKLPESNNILV